MISYVQIQEDYLKKGFEGERLAADHIRPHVLEYLRNQQVPLPEDLQVLIYCWCDASKAAEECLTSGVFLSREGFLHFRTGFNHSDDLTVLHDHCARSRNNCESQRITTSQSGSAPFEQPPNEVKSYFTEALFCADCERIVFDYETFKPFKNWLEMKRGEDTPSPANTVHKILPFLRSQLFRYHERDLLSATYPTNIGQGPVKVNQLSCGDSENPAFTTSSGRQTATEHVMRNQDGKRIDPHIDIADDMLIQLKNRRPKLCNNFHLLDTCLYGHSCQYAHGFLNDFEKAALREIAREQPCRYGALCADPTCYAGHRCLRKGRCGEACRFPPEMHFRIV